MKHGTTEYMLCRSLDTPNLLPGQGQGMFKQLLV